MGISSAPERFSDSALRARLRDIGVYSQESHTIRLKYLSSGRKRHGVTEWRDVWASTELGIGIGNWESEPKRSYCKRAADAIAGWRRPTGPSNVFQVGSVKNAHQRSKSSYTQAASRRPHTGPLGSLFSSRSFAQIAHYKAKVHPPLG